MKKRYKILVKGDNIFILHWVADGVLFGPGWASIATFVHTASNIQRCKQIVCLMNDCDKRINKDD